MNDTLQVVLIILGVAVALYIVVGTLLSVFVFRKASKQIDLVSGRMDDDFFENGGRRW